MSPQTACTTITRLTEIASSILEKGTKLFSLMVHFDSAESGTRNLHTVVTKTMKRTTYLDTHNVEYTMFLIVLRGTLECVAPEKQ